MIFVRCYDAGVRHAQAEAAETVAALPDSLTHEQQGSGLLCGCRASERLGQPLTHNRLCDLAGQFCAGMADVDANPQRFLYRAQHIAAGLPAAAAG
jgi:triphosphoribosyl-dephospho-CoA synthetase